MLYAYHSGTGRLETVTDSAGTKTKTFFNDLGRTTFVAENYDDFDGTVGTTISDATDKSKDRVTKYDYNALGQTKLTAYNGSSTATQVTEYLYEDNYNADLVTNTIYPDSSDTDSTGTDQVKIAYLLDGSVNTSWGQKIETTIRSLTIEIKVKHAAEIWAGVSGPSSKVRRGRTQIARPARTAITDEAGLSGRFVMQRYDDSNVTFHRAVHDIRLCQQSGQLHHRLSIRPGYLPRANLRTDLFNPV